MSVGSVIVRVGGEGDAQRVADDSSHPEFIWEARQRLKIELVHGVSKEEFQEAWTNRDTADDEVRPTVPPRIESFGLTDTARPLVIVWDSFHGGEILFPVTAYTPGPPGYSEGRFDELSEERDLSGSEKERTRKKRRHVQRRPRRREDDDVVRKLESLSGDDLVRELRNPSPEVFAYYERKVDEVERELASPAGQERLRRKFLKHLARRSPLTFQIEHDHVGSKVRARVRGLPVEGLGATEKGADRRLASALKKFATRDPLAIIKLVANRGKQVLSIDFGPKSIRVRVTA